MLDRLELEVIQCRLEVPFVLSTTVQPALKPASSANTSDSSSATQEATSSSVALSSAGPSQAGTGTEDNANPSAVIAMDTGEDHTPSLAQTTAPKPCAAGVLYTCMPERAALIKSVLNFLKKAIPDPTFSESMRGCELCTCTCKQNFNLYSCNFKRP